MLQIKIRQRIKTTTTHPELIGQEILLNNKLLLLKFPEFSLGSLETVQVGLQGLGPFNCVVRRLVKDLVMQNIRQEN